METHVYENRLADGETVATFGITAVICTLVAAGLHRRKPDYPIWLQFPDDDDEAAWKRVFINISVSYIKGFEKSLKNSLTSKV